MSDPGVDAQLNVLRALATQETVTSNTLTGFKDKSVDISEMFAPDVLDLGITGLGSQKFTKMCIRDRLSSSPACLWRTPPATLSWCAR